MGENSESAGSQSAFWTLFWKFIKLQSLFGRPTDFRVDDMKFEAEIYVVWTLKLLLRLFNDSKHLGTYYENELGKDWDKTKDCLSFKLAEKFCNDVRWTKENTKKKRGRTFKSLQEVRELIWFFRAMKESWNLICWTLIVKKNFN